MSSPQPLWVAKGNLEIGIGLTSGTALVSGVDLVGALPAEIQNFTLYSVGIVASSKQADAAKAFITFLSSPAAQTVLRAPSLERGEAAAPLQIRLLLRPHPPETDDASQAGLWHLRSNVWQRGDRWLFVAFLEFGGGSSTSVLAPRNGSVVLRPIDKTIEFAMDIPPIATDSKRLIAHPSG